MSLDVQDTVQHAMRRMLSRLPAFDDRPVAATSMGLIQPEIGAWVEVAEARRMALEAAEPVSVQMPKVQVDVAAAPPTFNITMPDIKVNIAAPPPAVVNIAAPPPAEVNVAAPNVTVAAPPPAEVNVAAPSVVVNVPEPKEFDIVPERDEKTGLVKRLKRVRK